MPSDHDYDLTTREGFMRRTDEQARRRIPERFRDAVATDPDVITWCDALTRAYAVGDPFAVTSLLVTGRTGVGKTYQAYGAIRRIAASGVVIGWLASTVPDMYAKLRPRDGADSEAEFRRFADVPLLLLDDLGAAKDSEWTEEVLYRLVNHRSERMRPSVITTNLPITGTVSLRSVVSERVFSRLAECTVVALKGRDRRLGGIMTALALEMPGAALRPRQYQVQALDAITEAYARGVDRQLVVLPTGGGKTVVFAHLVTRRAGRALILAHRDELIQQAADKLATVSGSLDIGIVKAKQDEHDAPVVVASVQTLARPGRVERLGGFSTVIVDEAHHAVARTYLEILGQLGCMGASGPLTAGFTATAGRSDKIGLGAVWQEITYQRGIVQMIAEGYLCDVRAMQIGTDFDLGNVQVRAGEYTDSSIEAEIERSDALEAAVKAYREYADGRLAVAFTPTIATAHALAAKLSAKGIPSEAVDGKMATADRRAVLGRLHRGQTRVVANCAVLTEGWDEPAVSCALMLRPTKSAPLFVQMAGRVLRPFVGKDDAIILDLAGSSETGLATIADLAGLPPGSVKKGQSLLDAAEETAALEKRKVAVAARRTRQIDLLRRSELRWLEVEGAWVLPAGADQVMILMPADGDREMWEVWRSEKGRALYMESGKPLALDWARGVGEEIARAQGGVLSRADAGWRNRAPSDAQVSALERMGYADKLAGITRGAASDLMTAHYAAKNIRKLMKAAAR